MLTQINLQPLNLIQYDEPLQSMLNPVLQRKNRKKLGVLSTNCCINKLVDLATQSGWDHEDARKKFAEGYVCLTCYRTVEKYSNTDTDNVQSPSLAPRHLLTLSDLAVISLL